MISSFIHQGRPKAGVRKKASTAQARSDTMSPTTAGRRVRMPAMRSNVIVDSEPFRANRAAHLELIAEFRALEAKVREASGRSDAKFRQRGQLPPRERVNLLL